MLRPDGFLIVGEGHWRRTPDQEYLDLLEATVADFNSHEGNIHAGVDAGFRHVFSSESSDEEWDDYEDTYAKNILDYIAAHPEDPD